MALIGTDRGKAGVVVVKRKAGRGAPTPRLVTMTESIFERLLKRPSECRARAEQERSEREASPRSAEG